MLDLSTILSIVWFICGPIVNAKNASYPTISNSTGDYFIASQNDTFNDQQLICTSDKLCHIECHGYATCHNTIINCNNASICDINCQRGEDRILGYPCQQASIYTSPIETNIHCQGLFTCQDMITIYTDYDKHPSSKTTLTCDDGYVLSDSCERVSLRNPSTMLDNYDKVTYEAFKVFCTRCDYYSIEKKTSIRSNTLATPTIINETGEYYFGSSSHVDFQCTHNELCYIDCGPGDCYDSNIDCDDSSICTVLCNDNDGCESLGEVKANNIREFNLQCQYHTCDQGYFNLTDIEIVNINCGKDGKYSCNNNQFDIQRANELSVFCGDGSCYQYLGQWNLRDIASATFICQGGCEHMDVILRNTSYTMSCLFGESDQARYHKACDGVDIDAIGSEIDIFCERGQSCNDMNICTDETLNIDCIGYNSCAALDICNDTSADININCEGENSCINDTIPTPRPIYTWTPPTKKPSVAPIIIVPTKADEQDQESTTNSPFAIWEIIVLSIVIVFIIMMIMYLKVLSGKKVEYQKSNWDEVATGTYEK